MTTRGSLARGQGQQPQQFQGHVQRWTKQWVPAGSAKGTSTINLLKWVPTGDRSETPAGTKFPHLVPVKDPDVKARLLGQRVPFDAATTTQPEAAQAAYQALAAVGGGLAAAEARGSAARQPEATSAALIDPPQPAPAGVSGEQSGASAREQVSSGLPEQGQAASAEGASMQTELPERGQAVSAEEGASMQIDQEEAAEDSMPPPHVHVVDPAALGPALGGGSRAVTPEPRAEPSMMDLTEH